MTTTQQRLDNYYAAEERILTAGFSVRLDVRSRQEAELSEIRKAINALESKLANETGKRSSSAGSLRYRTAVFSGR
ncbi:MAG: hypothetical protein ACOH1V_02345 [Stenotrophomonas sp.]